jgi:putative hydrolase of the HAD superfamily
MAEFETGAFDLPTFHRRFSEATGTDLPADRFEEVFLGAVRERTAMFAVLGALPVEDYVVGVLSNNVPVLCDRVRDDPRMQRVQHWVFSNEIAVRKPDPRAYQALTEALGVPPQETVFIDDAVANVEAARALGFRAIHMSDLASFLAGWRALLPDVPTGIDEHA